MRCFGVESVSGCSVCAGLFHGHGAPQGLAVDCLDRRGCQGGGFSARGVGPGWRLHGLRSGEWGREGQLGSVESAR